MGRPQRCLSADPGANNYQGSSCRPTVSDRIFPALTCTSVRSRDSQTLLPQIEREASLDAERAELTEATLMSRARDGDAHAFGELVRRHMRRAYFACLGLVGSHDEVVSGLGRIADSGATDFTALVMGGNPDEIGATRAALLAAR